MSTNIHVNCSGALFSSLQFELINNKKLQEGFLLGDVENFTYSSISDSEINNENVNVAINVSGYIPCSKMGSFYSGSGRVNFPYLKQFVDHNLKNVVGWYHSRKFSDTVYLKELRIHEQLREEMSHTDGHFLFALFSRIHPADSGTMDVNYKFQIMLNNNEFEGVPLKIVNMNDTSSSQYIRVAPSPSLYNSKSLETILENLQNLEPGVKEAEHLHNSLLNQLRNLLPKYGSIQEQHYKATRLVAKLQEFCHSSEIIPDFQPFKANDGDFDLMSLESSPKFKTKQVNCSSARDPIPSNCESVPKANRTDPFGFIEKEMEKHQDGGSTRRKVSKTKKEPEENSLTSEDNDSEMNTTKGKVKSKVLRKTANETEPLQAKSSNGRGKFNSCSPIRKTCKENNANNKKATLATSPKAKSIRASKLNSLDETSPPSSERHRSPSIGIKVKPKLRENPPLMDTNLCTSESPEF